MFKLFCKDMAFNLSILSAAGFGGGDEARVKLNANPHFV